MDRERRHQVRGRHWIITVQAPIGSDDKWVCKIPKRWEDNYTYRAQCYEKGHEGQSIHTHILISFKNPRMSNRLASEIIKENPGSECDVEVKKGKWEQAENYILKQNDTRINGRIPVVWGSRPQDYTRKEEREEECRNVINAIKESGLKGALEAYPSYIIERPNGCKLASSLINRENKKRTIMATIVWGDAGTGKSTWIQQQAKKKWGDDVYFWTKVGGSKDTIWFNGYTGQKCIILDDVSGRTLPYEYIIKLTGNDPLCVETKGGMEEAKWEEIYISSNYNPIGWYRNVWEENEETKNAFFRRIPRIIHVYKNEEGCAVWSLEKDEKPNIMLEDFEVIPNWERTPEWDREGEQEGEGSIGSNCNTDDIMVTNTLTHIPKKGPELKELEILWEKGMEAEWDAELGEMEDENESEELPKLGEDSVINGGNKE